MPSADILDRLFDVIRSRRGADPTESYVAHLLDGGVGRVAGKVREEAEELCEAAAGDDRAHTAHEAADLLFHSLVILELAGVEPEQVYDELERRFGTSGHEEKASRGGEGAGR